MKGVIVVGNQKGGVTKTTTALNIGVGLAQQGEKVLEIDMDPQATLTISLGLEPEELPDNICRVLCGDLPMSKAIHQVRENLFLIPSDTELAALEMQLISKTARERILAKAIEEIRNQFDYIIIDCPPQLSILTINALAAGDAVIVPVKTDYKSYRSVGYFLQTFQDIKDLVNPKIQMLGVVGTLHKKIATQHREVLEFLRLNYNVIGVLKETEEATKGVYDGKAAIEVRPKSEIAQQYRALVEYIKEA